MKKVVCLVLLVLGLTFPGFTQSARSDLRVPELPTADMHLSWADFRELLTLIQQAEAKEVKPPVPWSITQVDYSADATAGPSTHILATYTLEVWSEDWVSIPVLSTEAALGAALLDNAPSQLQSDGEWFNLILNSAGEHTLEIEFFVPLVEDAGNMYFQFPSVKAAVNRIALILPEDAAAITAPGAVRTQRSSGSQGQHTEIVLLSNEEVRVSWQRPALLREAPSPPPARVASQVYSLFEVTDSYLMCNSHIDYQVLRGEVNDFQLRLPVEAIVLEVVGTGAEWNVFEEDDVQRIEIALNHEVTGDYPIQVCWEWPLSGDVDSYTIPRINTEGVARESGSLYLAGGRNTKVDVDTGDTPLIRIAPDSYSWPESLDSVLHAFRYNQPDYNLQFRVRHEAPRIACQANTRYTAGPRLVSIKTELTYTVLRGEAERFSVSLPSWVNLLAVEGADMEWTLEESEDSQTIHVSLNRAVNDAYQIQLRYEMPVEETQTVFVVPAPVVFDVARQTGFLSVAAGGNVKIDIPEGVVGAQRIDTTELPNRMRSRGVSPVLHAFEYEEAGYTLPLAIQRLDDVAVRVASIDSAELTTVVSEEGMYITRARYMIRNNQRQFLSIDPGRETEIWGATVNGRPVSPAKDNLESSAVLIQLENSNEGLAGMTSFPVELIYMQHGPAPNGLLHTTQLKAPMVDILVDRITWQVFLADNRRVTDWDGNFEMLSTPTNGSSPNRGDLTFAQSETIYRFREGIERYFITDINNPGGSVIAQPKQFDGADFAGLSGSEQSTQDASTRLAGVLPIHINLPQTGIPHLFVRSLVAEGEEVVLHIQSQFKGISPYTTGLTLMLGLIAGYIGARYVRQGLCGKWNHRNLQLLVVVLVLFFLTSIFSHYHFALLALPALLGAIPILLPDCLARIPKRNVAGAEK